MTNPRQKKTFSTCHLVQKLIKMSKGISARSNFFELNIVMDEPVLLSECFFFDRHVVFSPTSMDC